MDRYFCIFVFSKLNQKINMQNAFLLTTKKYTEKQAGVLFFTFGMSQFLFQTPAGYIMDYSDKKVALLATAAILTTTVTVMTATLAQDYGANLGLMVFLKFLQGAITALIPPGLNSITQGIVGSVGMTHQVSRNEMMNHLGTSILVLTGCITAYFLYPNIGWLFIVSPIACAATVYYLFRIKPEHIDHNAARGLKVQSDAPDEVASQLSKPLPTLPGNKKISTQPSFVFGFEGSNNNATADGSSSTTEDPNVLRANTPLSVLRDPLLLLFTAVCFLFHTANGCVLPLVMQTLALGDGRRGIVMSGMCIIIAQLMMVCSAKVCGDYSRIYGRKILFLIGLFSVSIRCGIIVSLLSLQSQSAFVRVLLLSTQILDGVGAGVFGTMYILVTSDISGGTGRFSFTLGITTAAASIGGTVSGYLGEMLAQDFGYSKAFAILGAMSLIPAFSYMFLMPETLPADITDLGAAGSTKGGSPMDGIAEEDPITTPHEESDQPTSQYVLS
jgi:MFS family permease